MFSVCQKWKKALDYSWWNVKKLELTHWEYDEYPTYLKNVPTPDGKFSFLKSLFYKCGRFLTQLDLSAYGYSDIVPVINEYCQNLVKLRLRFINDDNQLVKHDAFSHLSNLKTLTVIFQPLKDRSNLFNLIIALRFLANTLTDLILYNWEDDKPGIYHEIDDLPDNIISVSLHLPKISFLIFTNSYEHLFFVGVLWTKSSEKNCDWWCTIFQKIIRIQEK